MKVLVTGGTGFVGGHLVDALTARGDIAISVDRKLDDHLEVMSVARRRVEKHRPDVIVHLASSCSTPASVVSPFQTYQDTVQTAVNILEVARETKIPVHITSSVKARDGMTPYGAAKRMVELWAFEYRSAYGMQIVVNRPGTIYGPGQEGSTDSGWIAWFCEAKKRNLPVVINGDGMQWRDLLHVDDYVKLILTQLDNPERYDTGEPWDVGGGYENAVTVSQIAHHLGLKITHGPARYGDSRRYIAYNNVPGWKPQISWSESETLAA